MAYIEAKLVETLGNFFSYWDVHAGIGTSIFDAILAAPCRGR